MQTIQFGFRGYRVKFLQRLLNRNGARPHVLEDGIYGRKTANAVRDFMARSQSLSPGTDGSVVGSAIWNNLGLRFEIDHGIHNVGQPTGMTCWSAAMSMARGSVQSIGPGHARLGADGGLSTEPQNIERFAHQNGMSVLSEMSSFSVASLVGWIQAGPLIAIGGGETSGNRWAHAVVMGALFSDRTGDGRGTMIQINDPWPPGGNGRMYGVFYTGAEAYLPGATYDLFGAYIIGRS